MERESDAEKTVLCKVRSQAKDTRRIVQKVCYEGVCILEMWINCTVFLISTVLPNLIPLLILSSATQKDKPIVQESIKNINELLVPFPALYKRLFAFRLLMSNRTDEEIMSFPRLLSIFYYAHPLLFFVKRVPQAVLSQKNRLVRQSFIHFVSDRRAFPYLHFPSFPTPSSSSEAVIMSSKRKKEMKVETTATHTITIIRTHFHIHVFILFSVLPKKPCRCTCLEWMVIEFHSFRKNGSLRISEKLQGNIFWPSDTSGTLDSKSSEITSRGALSEFWYPNLRAQWVTCLSFGWLLSLGIGHQNVE